MPTIQINTCSDCPHVGHSGAFTPGGAKPVCDHDDATNRVCQFKRNVPKKERWHWKYRQVKLDGAVPAWCPLNH